MQAREHAKPATTSDTPAQLLEDEAMDAVQGGLLPAVRSAPAGDSAATASFAKVGTGTLTLSSTSTY